ncbi:HAMP domain-containing protein [Mycobacterium leprae]|uniref:HAMP domain-containing protein n=1 Tax=Mycobacterium leprae TaxID=1769 RepID=UPI0007DB1ACA|nr:HAMP domain-containing protein [Mycobacterium leprae]OAR19721.1 hypothetical protein A8144_13575 [Mycobacterium leprae 3125609]OAX70169.1 hypothetical protein A3216_13590 [Mycobacterium leprae 7935681]
MLIIKRALAPLRRVVQTASHVAVLPLDRGDVVLPVGRFPNPMQTRHKEVGRLGSTLNQMLDHITAAPGHGKRTKPVAPVRRQRQSRIGHTAERHYNLISTTDGPDGRGQEGVHTR